MKRAVVLRKFVTSPRYGSSGFTLVELMMVIAILGLLSAVALPSFRDFILTQRVKSASFDLISSLSMSRSEAVKRNAQVTMQAATGGWSKGWTISSGGTTILVQQPLAGVDVTDSADIKLVTFRADGRLASAATNFNIETSPESDIDARCIVISLGGQASSKLGACS